MSNLVSIDDATSIGIDCCLLLLREDSHEVLELEFSPDGQYLASVARDAHVVIWKIDVKEVRDNAKGRLQVDMVSRDNRFWNEALLTCYN